MRLLTVRQPIIRAGRREGGGRERKRGRGRGGGKEIYREAFKENGMRGRMDRGGGGGGGAPEGGKGGLGEDHVNVLHVENVTPFYSSLPSLYLYNTKMLNSTHMIASKGRA